MLIIGYKKNKNKKKTWNNIISLIYKTEFLILKNLYIIVNIIINHN